MRQLDDVTKSESNMLNDNEWMFLLFLLLVEDAKQRNEQWKSFENELIYNNRFSSHHSIVKELHKKRDQATKVINKDTVFYRARCFDQTSFDKLVSYYLRENGYKEKQIKSILEEWSDQEKLLTLMPQIYNDVDSFENSALISAQRKWKRYVKFKGWGEKDSSAPNADLIGNGRANPDHIRYLYLCEDKTTPVYEVRPIIGQTVSVAKFKLLKDVKVYDLTLDIQDEIGEEKMQMPSLYNTIGQMFSRPYNGEPTKYLPTQYLAEEIKNMGFDGLRFNSSLHSGGINVVLFDPEACKAVSSDLVEIKSINIDMDRPLIYTIGDSSKNQTEVKK